MILSSPGFCIDKDLHGIHTQLSYEYNVMCDTQYCPSACTRMEKTKERRTHRKDEIRWNEKEELMKVSDLPGKDVKRERERSEAKQ